MSDMIKQLLEKQAEAFEQFKARNDRNDDRLAQLEGDFREMCKRSNRPELGGGPPTNQVMQWKTKDGLIIPVLTPDQKFASMGTADGEKHPRIGEVMASMIGVGSQKGLLEGVDPSGGYTVPTVLLRQWIDRLRAASHVVRSGALSTEIEGPTTIAKVTADPTPSWRAEAGSVAEAEQTFGAINLVPKSLACIVKVPRELAADSVNIAEILESCLAKAFAQEVDRVSLLGQGSAEPIGIVNTPGVNTYNMGTADGDDIVDYSQIVTGLQTLAEADAPDPTAAIMSPRSYFTLAGLRAAADGQPMTKPGCLADLALLHTTKISNANTFGNATNASKIVLGHFPLLLLAMRQQLQIQVLRETFAGTLQLGFLAHMRMDTAVMQPSAFAVCEGVIPT